MANVRVWQLASRGLSAGRMSRWRLALFALAGGLLLAGCRTALREGTAFRYEFAEPHMGTLWRITLYAPDFLTASNAVRAAFARVATLEGVMTDYDPESELMRLSKSTPGVPVKISAELFNILRQSERLSRVSDGAFDVTVGPVVQLWRRARRQRELAVEERRQAARRAVGFTKLRLNAMNQTVTLLGGNMRLDLGGIAKGYAADQALQVLGRLGLKRALVAASGDLAIGEAPPGKAGWRVGVGALDRSETNLVARLLLRQAGVSTSGDLEQSVLLDGVRYSHIVDPRTGRALTNRLQATIIADCASRSDALATTVCVLGPERGLSLVESDKGLAACLILPGSGTNTLVLKSRRFARFEKLHW